MYTCMYTRMYTYMYTHTHMADPTLMCQMSVQHVSEVAILKFRAHVCRVIYHRFPHTCAM